MCLSPIRNGPLGLAAAAPLIAGVMLAGPAPRAAGNAGAEKARHRGEIAQCAREEAHGRCRQLCAGRQVSENASATEPASLLAVFVADDGAQLTVFDG